MLMNKYKKKEKEHRKIKNKLDSLSDYRNRWNKDGLVIEWVPLDIKEFIGWTVTPTLKLGYHPNEEAVMYIMSWLMDTYLIKDPKIISYLRPVRHTYSKFHKAIVAKFKPLHPWHNEHPIYRCLYRDFIDLYLYKRMIKECPLHLKSAVKSFFYTNEKEDELVSLNRIQGKVQMKISYDTSEAFYFPIPLIQYRFEKTYVTEIGLIDGEKISESNKAWYDAYSNYKYSSCWGSRYRGKYWDVDMHKARMRTAYKNFRGRLKQVSELNEDTILEELSKTKVFRRNSKFYKWNF